jgi:hypothetical protein
VRTLDHQLHTYYSLAKLIQELTTGLLFTCNDLESGGLQDQGAWSSKDGDGVSSSSFGQGESGRHLFGGWLSHSMGMGTGDGAT